MPGTPGGDAESMQRTRIQLPLVNGLKLLGCLSCVRFCVSYSILVLEVLEYIDRQTSFKPTPFLIFSALRK